MAGDPLAAARPGPVGTRPATAKSREAWRAAAKAGAARERERAERAEAELKALGDRIDMVIAVKAAAERERAERAEAALSDALLRLAHGDAELHARLLADAGYEQPAGLRREPS